MQYRFHHIFSRPLFAFVMLLLFILTSSNAFVVAQNNGTQDLPKLRVEQLSIDQGLSQNTVNAMIQDSEGYLWIGTDDGLNRYNAYDVTIFRHKREDSLSIIDNQIMSIYEDTNHNIWIGTIAGVSIFDRKTQSFKSFYKKEGDPNTLVDNEVKAITEDKEGFIWLGTANGLSKYDYNNNSFTNFVASEEDSTMLGSNDIAKLYVDKANNLWIGTNSFGVNRWSSDRSEKKLYRYNRSDTTSLWGFGGYDIKEDADGNIWIASEGGFNQYNPNIDGFDRYRYQGKSYSLQSFTLGSNNTFWGAGHDYIYKLDLKTKEVIRYRTSFDALGQMPAIVRTKENVIWVASRNLGAIKYDPLTNQFDYYYYEIGNKNSLPQRNVWAMLKDSEGIVWVSTNNGFARIDRSGVIPKYYNIYGGEGKNDLKDSKTGALLETNEGQLWVATGADISRLVSFSEKGGAKFVTLEADLKDSTTVQRQILNLLQDKQGTVWVGTFDGFYKMTPSQRNEFGYEAQHFLDDEDIWTTYEDRSGILWLGTAQGLIKVIRDENNTPIDYKYYKHDPENLKSVSHNTVRAIAEDSKGNFWVGTTNGLNIMNRETGEFEHWGQRNDLANYAIYGILVDEKDNLWISTNFGLMRLLGDDSIDDAKRMTNYNPKDGLQSSEFNSGAFFKAEDGEMFFGGIQGLNAFYPQNIKASMYVPPVVMTDFKVLNRSVGIQSLGNPDSPLKVDISQTEEMTLTYEDRVVTFEFAAINFRRPEKTNYSYILEGFDKDWNEVGSRRFATYSNLPAGNYTFRVKASNSDGIENKEEIAIKIKVLPPWWKSWWFLTIATLSVLGISFGFYKSRMNAVKRQNDTLERLVGERTAEIGQQNLKLESQKTEIERSYSNIRVLSEIGQKITSILDLDTVISSVYEYVNELTDATAFGIGIYNPNKERIDFRGFIENGERIPDSYDNITDENKLSVVCLTRNEDIIINNFAKEHTKYISEVSLDRVGDMYQSIIYLPLLLEGKIVGVLTVQSHKTNAYSKNDLTILRTLASYISIALDNARTYTQLEGANELIRTKNQAIMDSIRYGETIQHAILPDPQDFIRNFDDHFIIFKPQAVVSGDFYWSIRTGNKTFVAVVDCTGHGVPGAFMSMIGNTILNEIVTLQDVTEPAQILENLNQGIFEALHQEDYQNLDGMDVCLCVIDDADELNMRVVNFAGAKRPLFILKNDKLIEVKGSRKSIGGRQKSDSDYEQRQLLLHPGDILYLTTDGYVDQNNSERIKYGTLHFKKILASFTGMSLHEQKEVLLEEMRNHMGEEEQRDDITLIGLKI
ncbi:two-component regulator propeller domain-containing protein [Bernardetia sp.]|uniref:two-component regulator propeller domain-containing protein n=1 Tax=Bernardetia sp. TaxID=1937974 RepID=UPI0025C2AEF2|nr:two-component regulator propeller domain-containing protein [Bernardetia sp.]